MEKYETLLICYRSGQMSAAQLQEHIRDDPAFAEYVRLRLTQ